MVKDIIIIVLVLIIGLSHYMGEPVGVIISGMITESDAFISQTVIDTTPR